MAVIAIYAVVLLLLYFVLFVPQQRRRKEAQALLASLEVGDEVVLASGIHGFISELEPTVVWIEVAPNVDLKVARSAIASRVNPLEPGQETGSGKGSDGNE